jgi:hypothetical protein
MTALRITSRVSVGDVLAAAVSVALPLLGVAPVASQERQEAARTASMPGSVIARKAARQSATRSHYGPRDVASGFAASDFDGPVFSGAGDGNIHASRVCDWRLSQ